MNFIFSGMEYFLLSSSVLFIFPVWIAIVSGQTLDNGDAQRKGGTAPDAELQSGCVWRINCKMQVCKSVACRYCEWEILTVHAQNSRSRFVCGNERDCELRRFSWCHPEEIRDALSRSYSCLPAEAVLPAWSFAGVQAFRQAMALACKTAEDIVEDGGVSAQFAAEWDFQFAFQFQSVYNAAHGSRHFAEEPGPEPSLHDIRQSQQP